MGGRQTWQVIGGKKEGLLVRTGKALKSPEAAGRLASGSVVEELALEGERLQYTLVSGDGPQTGWVSLKLKGSDLLVRADAGQADAGQAWQAPSTQAPLERLRAAVEERGDQAVQAAKCDMTLQIAVTDVTEGGSFYVRIEQGRAAVHEGCAEQADTTLTCTAVYLAEAWCGVFRLQADVAGDKALFRRLLRILFIEPQDPVEVDRRTPLDGVIRPPPGGVAPGSQPPLPSPPPAAPAWLRPDGEPAKKNKLMFLSLPWAGHVVHLRRMAQWFANRPEYEVHFAYISKDPPDVPKGCRLIGADASELTDVFDIVQDQLKAMGMDLFDRMAEDVALDLEKEGMKVLKFFLRIITAVKPTVIVADLGLNMSNFLTATCETYRTKCLLVASPGIKERWIRQMTPSSPSPAVQAPPDMPQIDLEQVVRGTFDTKTLPRAMQDILAVPGVELMRLLQIFGHMMNPDINKKAAITLYPSSSWMVEDQPVPGTEAFTCTLLPLPEQPAQLDREALHGLIAADLHEWMYDETSQDPIVYVAFGTIVQGARPLVEKLSAALDKGAWRVLWSLPKDMHAWLPEGLSLERWCVKSFVPQKDVFRCDRVRCFISHCGSNSTIEAMACGVPMVCHPFFMDQYEWARTVRRHLRAGVQVDKFDSDADAIRLAVSEVLQDPTYRQNAQAVSRRLAEQARQVASILGPEMSSKDNLGPGVAVVAALVLSIMKGKNPSEIIDLVAKTNM
uniref:UDP-glycosyltransferases domain-containing protein n=1 Tax=Zooxanthella nutricula TaxID=1333877 RepID=A0A7S2PP93_9DINO